MSKKEEKIKRTISEVKEPQSRAKRIRMLLKKNKTIFSSKEKITDFKEPVAFLRRRGGVTEFHEDASKGVFSFTHSDGKYREIYLDPSTQGTMDYGKRKFKYYWLHEDFPLPLPENPLITADVVNLILEKSMMDLKKLNERAHEMQLKTWKTIAWIVAGGVGLYLLYKSGAFTKIVDMVTGHKETPPVIINNVTGGNSLAITGQIILISMYTDIRRDFNRAKRRIKSLIQSHK